MYCWRLSSCGGFLGAGSGVLGRFPVREVPEEGGRGYGQDEWRDSICGDEYTGEESNSDLYISKCR